MLKSFYLTNIPFFLLGLAVVLFSFGLMMPLSFVLGFVVLLVIVLLIVIETLVMYRKDSILEFKRKLPRRLSNGDENPVQIEFKNLLDRTLQVELVENLPYQLQIFDFKKKFRLIANQHLYSQYSVVPVIRGEYIWNSAVLYCKLSKWSLVARKIIFESEQTADCYPSFLQFSDLNLKTQIENHERNELQVKRIGQSLEFEQIKEYSSGDDYRHINWKASAKRGHLMLNQYQDERSQDIYCAIDMGRTMKMPFHNQTLLDYAINAALALSKAVINTKDKAGVMAFGYNKVEHLTPRKEWRQFGKINELLYNLQTDFLESDFEYLYKFVRVNIKRRSLIVIFTNFDSENAMRRNFQYLRDIARHHLLLVVFFENSEISENLKKEASNLKSVYEKGVGFDRIQKGQLITRELQNAGIRTVLSPPEKLSIQVIKKYAEIKKQQIL
jgi:uncharacterized protein (DUF58 family)